jgi:hypothetical protein
MAARLAASTRAPDTIEIMPENWPALRVFLGLETQWRRAGLGGVAVGLDYGALPVVAGCLGIPTDADLLARLKVLEGAAISAMMVRR